MPTCTIVIRDNVNCKLVGLDALLRRKISDSLKFMVPHARHTPSFKLGRWDGKVAFMTVAGTTFVNLLDRLIPMVIEAGYEIEIDDQRPPVAFEFPEITNDLLSDRTWPEGHQIAGQPIMLRDHQVGALQRYTDNLQSLQEISTAAGKTVLTAALSLLVEPYGRSIVIVPSKSLVEQTEEDYRNIGLDVGVYYGDRKETNHIHTICTWQSLAVFRKKDKKGKVKEDGPELSIDSFLEGVVCVMVDECFAPSTLILTPDGYERIDTLAQGDRIINWSEQEKVFKEDTVIKVHVNLPGAQSEQMYELVMDDGVKVQVSGNHRFLTTIGWVRADQLTPEMEIISISK